MKFNCTMCPKYFFSERGLNSHFLFDHNTLKPECKNWKAVDDYNLKMQRMFYRAKDLIRQLDKIIKRMPEDRLSWTVDMTKTKNDLSELYTILNELLESKYHLPKMSWKISKALLYWEKQL